MNHFDFPLTDSFLERFGEFGDYINASGLLELGPGKSESSKKKRLMAMEAESCISDEPGLCCLAAVFLFQNLLDQSHSISQRIDSAMGSYLHGIMHRREGDFSNANYWFRKASELEIFTALSKQIQMDSLILPKLKDELMCFDPFLLTERVEKRDSETKRSLMRVTFLELFCVFETCYGQVQG